MLTVAVHPLHNWLRRKGYPPGVGVAAGCRRARSDNSTGPAEVALEGGAQVRERVPVRVRVRRQRRREVCDLEHRDRYLKLVVMGNR